MKIRRHSESHIVELDDGATWRDSQVVNIDHSLFRMTESAAPPLRGRDASNPHVQPCFATRKRRAPKTFKASKLKWADRNGHIPIRRLFYLKVHLLLCLRIL